MPNAESAKFIVLKHLEDRGYKFDKVVALNDHRYFFVRGIEGSPNVAIIFKHEWFEKFPEFAVKYNWLDAKGNVEKTEGDSINITEAEYFERNNVEFIYTLYSPRIKCDLYWAIYKISLEHFKARRHERPEPNKEGKRVFSFSKHCYEMVDIYLKEDRPCTKQSQVSTQEKLQPGLVNFQR